MTALLLLLSGCVAKIGDLNEYTPTPLRDTEFMPDKKELKHPKTKVVLLRMKNGILKNARDANLAQSMNATLLGALTSDGSVEVIDRDIDAYLSSEVKFSELSSQEDIYGDDDRIASYAIKGEISGASFSSRYVPEIVWYDKKGKAYYEPPYYVYTARVEGILTIYEIPSMRVIKSVNMYGHNSYSEESRYKKRFDAALMKKAGNSAIYSARRQFKNFFAPKGYILYKRVDGDDEIYEVSLGSSEGLHHGDDIRVYRKQRFANPITHEEEIDDIVIAQGNVSEIIHSHNAWIIIDEVHSGYEIRLGDYIKKRH
jgi:hypothetical protein